MKRLIPGLLAVILMLGFTSCNKQDYTCYCKMSNGTDRSFELGRMSNNAAQKACNQQQMDLTVSSVGTVGSCKLVY